LLFSEKHYKIDLLKGKKNEKYYQRIKKTAGRERRRRRP
jgi:hypothetical protein